MCFILKTSSHIIKYRKEAINSQRCGFQLGLCCLPASLPKKHQNLENEGYLMHPVGGNPPDMILESPLQTIRTIQIYGFIINIITIVYIYVFCIIKHYSLVGESKSCGIKECK